MTLEKNQCQVKYYVLNIYIVPFWLLLGPKEGPIPNAKKHPFSPNCWLKIPNLKILKNSTWEIQLEHNYDFLSFSSQTVLLKDNKALKPSCNVLGHDLSIFQPLKHVITFPNFLFLWANFPNSEGPCPNYWNTVYREISEIFQCEHTQIAWFLVQNQCAHWKSVPLNMSVQNSWDKDYIYIYIYI